MIHARAYLGSLRRLGRDVRLCLISTALTGFTVSGGIHGVLLNLYLLRLGYGTQFIGLVNAMSPLATVGSSLPAGAIGRRWGSRRTMIAGMVLCVVGSGLLPLPSLGGAAQNAWILATYLLVGLGTALYLVNVSPFLMSATAATERNHAFSMRMSLTPLAGFAGSLVGGLLPGVFGTSLGIPLSQPEPYRYPLLIATALLIPAIPVLVAAKSPCEQDEEEGNAGAVVPTRGGTMPAGLIVILATIGFLRVMGEGGPRAFFNVYLDEGLHVPTAQIGVMISLGKLLAVPASLAMPLLAGRWGNGRTVVLGALGVVLSLLPMALIPDPLAAGIGFVGMTALAAIARSAFIVFAMEAVRPRWRAMMSGATTMSAAVGWGATAWAGGYLIQAVGYRYVFLIGSGVTLVGALLFWARFCRSYPVSSSQAP